MTLLNRRSLLKFAPALALAPYARLLAAESERPLGVALLGLGNYSEKQLGPALKKTRNARLTGIVTGSPEKIPVWQAEYGVPDKNVYNYDNLDSIADNPDIDIVYVVTPTGLHPEFTIRALKAGKHVICEKPMAPTVEECDRMIAAAKEAGKTLQIGYRLHWDPFHRRVMEATKNREFGDWTSMDTGLGYRVNKFEGRNRWRIGKLGVAGALYDLGVYPIQGALYSAHENPVRVTARHSTDRPEMFDEVPEHWEWELEFSNGRKAKGQASYGRGSNLLLVNTGQGELKIQPSYGYDGQIGQTPAGPMELEHVFQQQLQIEGQVDAIVRGEPSLTPGEMGRRDIRIVRAIMEAAECGEPVGIDGFAY